MKNRIFKWLIIIFCVITRNQEIYAQITVTNTNSANALAQKLVGAGVTISNANTLCNGNQAGLFTVTSSNLGIDSGIVLTTGNVSTIGLVTGVNGPQAAFANSNQGTVGDANLDVLAGTSTFDRCVLEFDFKADGDSINFQYIFGSEEYPAFNCSNYNDVFGFFISGPGYATPINIALIPNTTIPVAINSVNNGVVSTGASIANCNAMGAGSPFTSYYVNNTGGTSLTYDGFTNLFTAKASIQQCQTYHLKLAIADGFDHIFDSGVFLKAGSLISNSVSLEVQADTFNAGNPFLYEGCDSAIIKIKRHLIQTVANTDTIQLIVSGTSSNGIDYPAFASSYIYSNNINDSVKTFSIKPFNDFITEGLETIKIVLLDRCGTHVDSTLIEIKDPPTFSITNNDTLICQGGQVQILGTFNADLNYSWLPTQGVTNPNQFGAILAPNTTTTYTLTGTYSGCNPVVDTIKVSVQPQPSLNISATNILCNGLTNGSIIANGTVGSNPIAFTLMPGPVVQNGSPTTFSNLAAGIYTITVSSGLGCTKSLVSTITQPTPLVWSTTTALNIACNTNNVGQITTIATGGSGSKTYTLNPGNIVNTNGSFTGLAGGNYTITAKDANNCSIFTVLTISQIANLNWVTTASTNISCFGQVNGTITTSALGGTGAITYSLSPGNLTNPFGSYTGLAAGTYTVLASDATTCTASSIFTIVQPPILTSTSSSIGLNCNANLSGVIQANTIGGTPPLTYTLNPGGQSNTSGLFSSLAAGNYTVTTSDINGCSATTSQTLSQPPAIIFTNIAKIQPTCLQPTIGSITVTVSGGISPLTFALNSGSFQSSSTFSSLTAGAYTITAKDANGCTKTYLTFLTVTNAPNLTNQTLPIVCSMTTTDLNVTASGGTPIYTYTLLPSGATNTTGAFGPATAGTYTVNVSDANGCTKSLVIVIQPPLPLAWQSFVVTKVPCNATTGGGLNVTAMNGTPIYTYAITPSNSSNVTGVFSNLGLGSYSVTATDANGCTVSSVVLMTAAPPLSFNTPIKTNVSCNGANTGSITLPITGGTGTKTYTINPSGLSNTTGTFLNLTAGSYTITVSDVYNCSNSTIVALTQPNALVLNPPNLTLPSCSPGGNGVIAINVQGGTSPYSYKLNTGSYQTSGTFSNLNIGIYTIQVKDANNCTTSSVVNLSNPNAMSFNTVNVSQSYCTGSAIGNLQAIVANGSGVITYSVNPGNLTNNTGVFNTLPVNIYTVSASDANGCTITSTATILQPNVLSWANSNVTNISCSGLGDGHLQVLASGGIGSLTYNIMPLNISNSLGTFSNLIGNNYTVTTVDAAGCTISTTINLINPSPIAWSNLTSTNVVCNATPSGSISATAIGGTGVLTYVLTPSAATNSTGVFSNIVNNNYTVNVTDANGCTNSTSFVISQPPPFGITSINSTMPTCALGNNASITVNASGGNLPYQFQLNTGTSQASNVFNNVGVSTYTVSVTDAAGCTKTSSVTISNPAAPSITNVVAQDVLCNGNSNGSIQATASGGVGSLMYNLMPTNSNTLNGTYANLVANSYTITVTDGNGCTATSNVLVNQPPILVWDSVNNRDISCYGGSNGLVTSSASGGAGIITYTLLPNNTSNTIGAFLGLSVGVYTLNATDTNGCQVSAVFVINQAPPIVWNPIVSTSPSCIGMTNGSIQATASGGVGTFSYKLQPGNITNTTGFYNNLIIGPYTITAKDANSCTLTTLVNVQPPAPVSMSNAVTTFASCSPGCDGSATIIASGGNGVYSYSINGGTSFQNSNLFSSLCTGVYTITIKDGNGCTGTGIANISTATGPNLITATNTLPTCNNSTNGTINTNATGGTGTVTYVLNPGNISNTSGAFSSLTTGLYTVVATDANGCSISTVVDILQPLPLILGIPSVTSTTCFGGNNGAFSINANGGTGLITYTIQPSAIQNTTGVFNGLSAVTYTVTATDVNNCSTTALVTIGQPNQIITTLDSISPISCNGGNNGVLYLSSSNGTGSFTYSLQPINSNSNTGVFSNLLAGNYTATVTDANACTNSIIIVLNEPSALQITQVTSTTPSCIPGGDASMTITATGATPSYSYSVNSIPYQSTSTFNNLSLGVYTVMVKDANGCTTSSIANVINAASPIISNVAISQASCNPGCDGSTAITATGGNGAYSYSINAGITFQNTALFSGVCAGTYTIIVKDANGCTGSSVVTISTANGPSQLNATSILPSCSNSTNGSITATIAGGVGTISYLLNPGNVSNTSGVFNGLTTGLYTILATDANGCSVNTIVNILQPLPLILSAPIITNVNCYAGNNGSISINATGGTGLITYAIQPLAIQNTNGLFNTLVSNNYTITATDINGCSTTALTNVTQPTQLVSNIDSITQVSCFGGNDAIIAVTTTGGTGTISYVLQPNNVNSTTGQFTNLTAGNYTVVSTDINGCTNTITINVTQPSVLQISQITSTTPSCIPGGDALMTIMANGATPTYTYSINGNPFQSNSIFNNLSLGLYTVTVKDANGCSVTSTASIMNSASPIITSILATEASCNPGCDANISIAAGSGTGMLQFSIDQLNYQTSSAFANLCAANYTVTVKDATGCTSTSALTITTVASPVITNISGSNLLCNVGSGTGNGSITLSVSGGSGVINYLLVPGNIQNTTGVFNNLVANTYSISGTDANGCTLSTSIVIAQPTPIIFDTITSTPILCNAGANASITSPALGGTPPYTYSILPSGTFSLPNSFINLSGNVTYTITAIDANGCSISTTYFIANPTTVSIDSILNTPVTCFGQNNGTLTGFANGGTGQLQYLLQPGSISNTTGLFSNLGGNLYTLTVTDSNGCFTSSTSNLFEPLQLVISSTLANNITCFGQVNGSIQVAALGGMPTLSYELLPLNQVNSSGQFNLLAAATYTIKVTDANGCSAQTSAQIIEPSQVVFNSISFQHVKCFNANNAAIQANASGGVGTINYTLQPGSIINTSGIFSNLGVNQYTLTAKDANNCSIDTIINITQPNQISLTLDSIKNVSCFGGNNGLIAVSTIGGTLPYLYTLQPGFNSLAGFYPNVTAGNYTIKVNDANGCKDSITGIVITQPTQIQYTAVTHQDLTCYSSTSGSITAIANGGTGALVYSISPINLSVQSTPGYFTNLNGGIYTITATDANNCIATTIVVVQNYLLLVSNIIINQPICNGDVNGSLQLSAIGGSIPLLFSLNNSPFSTQNTFTNLAAATYTIKIKDALGCEMDTIIDLTEPDKVGAVVYLEDTKCNTLDDGLIQASGTGGRFDYTYYLTPGQSPNKSGLFENLKVNNYTLTVKDSSGCKFDTTLTIRPPLDPLRMAITKENIGCYGIGVEGWAKANPKGGKEPYLYTWNTSDTTQKISDLTAGVYTVKVVDRNNCEVSGQVEIEAGYCCTQLFAPTAFSPNGDGKNDNWRMTTSTGVKILQYEIYDRWGKRVWQSFDIKESWDGNLNGHGMQVDTYFYILRYTCISDGLNYLKKGEFALIR